MGHHCVVRAHAQVGNNNNTASYPISRTPANINSGANARWGGLLWLNKLYLDCKKNMLELGRCLKI
jgi:hypothetical protein